MSEDIIYFYRGFKAMEMSIGESRVRGGYSRWPLALAAVALAAFLLYFLPPKGGFTTLPPSGGGGETAKPALILASIEVEGLGSVLANGTSKLLWNSTKPFALALEAAPEKCWVFKGWLVNGSFYGSQPNATLLVKGNTTVKAVFELLAYTVSIEPVFHPASQSANASARVNGTLYQLPVNLIAPACSLLEVEPVAPEGWEALNGSLRVVVNGSVEVGLAFAKVVARVELRGVIVPVLVNGTVVANDTVLKLPFNSTLYIEPYGADQAGCVLFNGTHKVCLVGWRIEPPGLELAFRYLSWPANADLLMTQLVTFTKAEHPATYTEVLTPGGWVKTQVVPGAKWMVVPFQAEYEYKGGGWFWVSGPEWGIFIEVPPWRRLRAYVNYTQLPDAGVGRFDVVVRNDQVYFSLGYVIGPESRHVFTINWTFVEVFGSTHFERGIDAFKMKDVWLREFENYVCYPLTGICCRDETITGVGPSTRVMEGIGVGWLLVEGGGEAWIKVEVLEPRS